MTDLHKSQTLQHPKTGDMLDITLLDNTTYIISGTNLHCECSVEQTQLQLRLFEEAGFTNITHK